MMVDAKRYTIGRIAVTNLSTLTESLELRRVEGATSEKLVALSKLRFLRCDLLGRIVDHDQAELAAIEAITLSPDTGRKSYMELTYRFAVRKSALFIPPDFQYIDRPGGTGRLNNAVVFGAQLGIKLVSPQSKRI